MRKSDCRPVDGIFLLDKPVGLTSNRALQEVKRRFGACKAGHTGSLDPLASGLLPICLGEATKVSQYLLDADKTYETTLELGVTTTTYDREGEVVAIRPVEVSQERIEAVLAAFRGEIWQRPPAYSAIKQGGQPLYKKARAGQVIEVEPRRVRVDALRLVAFDGRLLTLEVRVSKGTYIRSLAHDIGEALGCGAHVTRLRRTALGDISVGLAHGLEAAGTAEGLLLPPDAALQALPAIRLAAGAARNLQQGQQVFAGAGVAPGNVRIYGEDGVFLGVGEVSEPGWLAPRRLRATSPAGAFSAEKSVEDGGSRG